METFTCEDCTNGFTYCDDRYLGCAKGHDTSKYGPHNCHDYEFADYEIIYDKEGE